MADGLRSVARAYYERASEEERDEAKNFFKKLDANEDGVISLEEFKRGCDSGEEFFEKLDSKGGGSLDFWDVLVVFYQRRNAISISRCDGCNQKLFGPYFSCVVCMDYYPNTYDLCCDCHRGGKLNHKHPLRFMLHDQAALVKFIQKKTHPAKAMELNRDRSKHNSASEWEELGEIAKAYYEASPPETQEQAKEFFNSMDSNKEGKVSLEEFSPFMSSKGYKLTSTPNFFKKLDTDGDGNLQFWDVITLYYIIKSARPFCNCCGEFIPQTYFICVTCRSFDLCRHCFQLNRHNHSHFGRPVRFLDNFLLLESKHGSSASACCEALNAGQRTRIYEPLRINCAVSFNSNIL